MSKLFRERAFILGFLAGILVVIGLNLITAFAPGSCKDCESQIGFPLSFYRRAFTKCNSTPDSSADIDCFIWYFSEIRLTVNIVLTLIFSFVLGFIFKTVRQNSDRKN